MIGSARLERRVRRDFPDPGSAPEILRILGELPDTAGYDPDRFCSERILAAVVLLAEGSIHRFREAVDLATTDWRDLLVEAGLAHADWPARLDDELGPSVGAAS